MKRANESTPAMLKTMLSSPEAIHEITKPYIAKLTEAVIEESKTHLKKVVDILLRISRYIFFSAIDIDLNFMGGGVGGCFGDLAYVFEKMITMLIVLFSEPTEVDKQAHLADIRSNAEQSENKLKDTNFIPIVQNALSSFYLLYPPFIIFEFLVLPNSS